LLVELRNNMPRLALGFWQTPFGAAKR
jgi:hypothetical protein